MEFLDRLIETEISDSFIINKKDMTVTFKLTNIDFKYLEKRLVNIFPERYKQFFESDKEYLEIIRYKEDKGE